MACDVPVSSMSDNVPETPIRSAVDTKNPVFSVLGGSFGLHKSSSHGCKQSTRRERRAGWRLQLWTGKSHCVVPLLIVQLASAVGEASWLTILPGRTRTESWAMAIRAIGICRRGSQPSYSHSMSSQMSRAAMSRQRCSVVRMECSCSRHGVHKMTTCTLCR